MSSPLFEAALYQPADSLRPRKLAALMFNPGVYGRDRVGLEVRRTKFDLLGLLTRGGPR
jgi:hypothetical protein